MEEREREKKRQSERERERERERKWEERGGGKERSNKQLILVRAPVC